MKVASEEVQGKFHSLRAQFNRERSKTKQSKSGSGASEVYNSKWEYFQSLKCLNVGTVSGLTISNLPKPIDTDESSISSEGSLSPNNNNEIASGSSNDSITNEKTRHKKRKQSFEPEADDVLNIALAVLDKGRNVLDVFGEFVAGELRQMVDPVLRISTKRERMQVLIHYGKFNNQNPTQMTSNFDYSIQSQPNVHSTKHAITILWSFRPTIHVNSCRQNPNVFTQL